MKSAFRLLVVFACILILISACSSGSDSSCSDNCGIPNQTPGNGDNPLNPGLPVPINPPDNPPPEFNPTPPDAVGPAAPTNPTPNGITDIPNLTVDNTLIGSWTSIVGTAEVAYEFKADQSCQWGVANYQNTLVIQDCTWGMLNTDSAKILLIQESDGSWQAYHYEQVSNDDFRITGGALAVDSWLFNRAVDGTLTNEFPNRWFIGTWDFSPNLDYRQVWEFGLAGVMQVTTFRKEYFDINLGLVPEAQIASSLGQWSISLDAKNLSFQLDQDPPLETGAPQSGTYPLADMSDHTFTLTGATTDIIFVTWKRRNIFLFRPDPYAGQYTGPSTTLNISNAGTNQYSVEAIYQGAIHNWSGQIVNDSLVVDLPPDLQNITGNTFTVDREFNGIRISGGSSAVIAYFPQKLNKTSETKLPDPPSFVGGSWYYRSKYNLGDKAYAFMSDGTYYSRDGSIFDYGKYSYDPQQSTINIDPVCSSPYQYIYGLVENQFVLAYPQAGGSGYYFETYHYEPLSIETADVRNLQIQASRAIEAEKSFATFPIGDINPNYVVPVPTTVVTLKGIQIVNPDLNPNDVIAAAKVFSNFEVYHWIEPALLCYADVVGGCNEGFFQFYPNGRVLYYSDTKWGVGAISGNLLYDGFSVWTSYSIEGDKIFLGDGSTLDFVEGRNKVRFGEMCYTGFVAAN